jgi:hypothetical protein
MAGEKDISQYLNKKDFKELFSFQENDRTKKELRRDFQLLNQTCQGQIKFKNLIGKSGPLTIYRLLSDFQSKIRKANQSSICH